jgi:hypothetical protein
MTITAQLHAVRFEHLLPGRLPAGGSLTTANEAFALRDERTPAAGTRPAAGPMATAAEASAMRFEDRLPERTLEEVR